VITEKQALDALPPYGFVRNYAAYAVAQTTSPLAFHVGVGLSMLAVTCPTNYGVRYAVNQRPNLFVMIAGRSGDDQKCLPGDALVATADGPARVDELTPHHGVNALYGNWRARAWDGAAVVDAPAWMPVPAGVQPVHTVQLKNGLTCRFGHRHPLLTKRGWVMTRDVTESDRVAVPLTVPDIEARHLGHATLALTGMLLSDGGLTQPDWAYTKRDAAVRGFYVQQLQALGFSESGDAAHRYAVRDDRGTVRMGRASSLIHTLRVHGMPEVKSPKRYIPRLFKALSRAETGHLLGGFWLGDGVLDARKVKTRTGRVRRAVRIAFSSRSKQLAQDVLDLLLFMGLPTTLTTYNVKYKGEARPVWTATVVGRKAKKQFLDMVKGGVIYAPPLLATADEMLAILADVEHAGGRRPDVDENGLWWVPVVGNTVTSREECFDIHVPQHHTFVAERVVTHNSTAIEIGREILFEAAPSLIGNHPASDAALVEDLSKQPTQILIYKEAGQLLASTKKGYMEPLKTMLTDLADSSAVQRSKTSKKDKGKADSYRVDNPRLSVLGGCSFPFLEKHTEAVDWGGGFLGRWALICAQRERNDCWPQGSTDGREELVKALEIRAHHPEAGWCLGANEQAYTIWKDWFDDVQHRALPPLVAGIRTRAPVFALKAALLYAWDFGPAKNPEAWRIDPSVLTPAIAFAEMYLDSVISLSEKLVEHPDARIRKKVLDTFNESNVLTMGQILKITKIRKRTVSEILEALTEEGTLKRTNLPGGKSVYIRQGIV
jgi:hypothetical protein